MEGSLLSGANDVLLRNDQLQEIAAQAGYTLQRGAGDALVFLRKANESDDSIPFPTVVEVYTATGDAVTYIPHPRQRVYRLFHFGAAFSRDAIAEVFKHPWNDLHFTYRMSDVVERPAESVPSAPPPCSLQSALERQVAIVDRELSDLRLERASLARRLRTLASNDGSESSQYEASSADMDVSKQIDRLSRGGQQHRKAPPRPMAADQSTKAASNDRGSRRQPGSGDDISQRVGSSRPAVHSHDDEVGGGGFSQSTLSGSKAGPADRIRGNKAIWSLWCPETADDFSQKWSSKPVAQVALGRGYVLAFEDGSVTWRDICPLLESKLRQQGLHPSTNGGKVRIRYLVLGGESNFYVKFDNGRMEWCGQDSFGDTLRRGVNDRRLLVEKVAFGQHGSWLVLWSDGTYESEGIPTTLVERLRRNRTRSDASPLGERSGGMASGVKDITVGPAGEWFVIYKDHSVQADNLPDALYKSLSQIREKSGRVRQIVFGENRSWFVRFWDGLK